jgi:integrase
MASLHRRIRKKAGLSSDLRFTGFRHGGLTEIGDSGEADVRALSGHSTLEVTRIYNKANQERRVESRPAPRTYRDAHRRRGAERTVDVKMRV